MGGFENLKEDPFKDVVAKVQEQPMDFSYTQPKEEENKGFEGFDMGIVNEGDFNRNEEGFGGEGKAEGVQQEKEEDQGFPTMDIKQEDNGFGGFDYNQAAQQPQGFGFEGGFNDFAF